MAVNRSTGNSEFECPTADLSETDIHRTRNSTAHHHFLPIAQTGSQWCGRDSLKNLVILGDSYSASAHEDTVDDFAWSDHVASLAPFAVEVHNFSMPGATAKYHLRSQLTWFFSRFSKTGQDEPETVGLDPEETTYVLFLGINDCGTTDADDLESIDIVFDTVHQLYMRARARNFVMIDVPPLDRSPGGLSCAAELKDRVETWNDLLQKETADFASGGTQATQSVFLFSSNAVLTDVLDSPVKFKFSEDNVMEEGGSIWQDELHRSITICFRPFSF